MHRDMPGVEGEEDRRAHCPLPCPVPSLPCLLDGMLLAGIPCCSASSVGQAEHLARESQGSSSVPPQPLFLSGSVIAAPKGASPFKSTILISTRRGPVHGSPAQPCTIPELGGLREQNVLKQVSGPRRGPGTFSRRHEYH